MRMVIQMMEQMGQPTGGPSSSELTQNSTLELNPQHPIVYKLNELRKVNQPKAQMIAKQFLEQVMMMSGFQYSLPDNLKRSEKLLVDYLNKVSARVDRTVLVPEIEIPDQKS